jgi:hypothetical protein
MFEYFLMGYLVIGAIIAITSREVISTKMMEKFIQNNKLPSNREFKEAVFLFSLFVTIIWGISAILLIFGVKDE